MTRVLRVLTTLAVLSTPAMAQGQTVEAGGLTPEHVVARLMSFDRDADGQLAAGELAERLHPLLARADADGNLILDASELRAAVIAAPAAPPVGQRAIFTGSYVFAHDTEFSSRSHIEGALDDLRLAPETHALARTIAVAYADMIDAEARAELTASLAPALDAHGLKQLEPEVLRWGLGRVRSSDARAVVGRFLFESDPLVRMLDLEPALQARATAALERFRTRLRLIEADRMELAGHLSSLLAADEREDFLAALARRPIVPASAVALR
jgi:hypothetical protein